MSTRKELTSCHLCGQRTTSAQCAHLCPHGKPCTFPTDTAGYVLSWTTNGCGSCDRARKLKPRSKWQRVDKTAI